MNSTLLTLAVFFLSIAALVVSRTPAVPGRGWQLFRVLFPSWKFFDEPGETPELFVRLEPREAAFGDWHKILTAPKRSWYSLFLNPHGNYSLACHSLLEQLCRDLEECGEEDPKELERSVSFMLVKNLVRFELRHSKRIPSPEPFRFQFKLATESSDVMISPVYDG